MTRTVCWLCAQPMVQLFDKFEPNYPGDLPNTIRNYLKSTGFESSHFRRLAVKFSGHLGLCVACAQPSASASTHKTTSASRVEVRAPSNPNASSLCSQNVREHSFGEGGGVAHDAGEPEGQRHALKSRSDAPQPNLWAMRTYLHSHSPLSFTLQHTATHSMATVKCPLCCMHIVADTYAGPRPPVGRAHKVRREVPARRGKRLAQVPLPGPSSSGLASLSAPLAVHVEYCTDLLLLMRFCFARRRRPTRSSSSR